MASFLASMTDHQAKCDQVLAAAAEARVNFINLQFTDIVGALKSVSIPFDQLEDALKHGKWFDGSSIEGFARIAESDMFLMPDPDTFVLIPWEADEAAQREKEVTARLICDVYTPKGDPFPGDPRWVLKRLLREAYELGYVFNTGPELEFFLFKPEAGKPLQPVPHDSGGYFDLVTDLGSDVRKDMVNALEAMGIEVEAAHHEVAVSQHEIDFVYSDALTTADSTVTLRYALKAVAQRYGLYCTFMPKPIYGVNGSGMHTHQSLWDVERQENAFFDESYPYRLSAVARHFVAGQLAHARGMCAVLSPTVNSYKRLVPGYEAPVYVSWGQVNRSALIRIPRVSPGKKEATRLELRSPDPSCNPYLAFAVMLACGLDGIKRKLEPPEPTEESLYEMEDTHRRRRNIETLPGSLAEALEALKQDEVVQQALGEHVYERFVEAKQQEWDAYRAQVTPWEIRTYLERF